MIAGLDPTEVQLLRSASIFAGLSDHDFGLLADLSRSVKVPRGRILFSQDEPATAFFIVVRGWVSLLRDQPDGTRTVLRIVGPGESFAEATMTPCARYPLGAEVASDARLVRIDTGRLRALIMEHPALSLSLVAAVFRQSNRLLDQIEHLKSWPIERRLARLLLRMGDVVGTEACSFSLPVEQNLIAARLATTPATLSRTLKGLTRLGITANRGRITMRDPTVVLRFVEGRAGA